MGQEQLRTRRLQKAFCILMLLSWPVNMSKVMKGFVFSLYLLGKVVSELGRSSWNED